ncbi:MAG: alcohol dehydrogenase catalytic domain-containing protein [Phycisphaerae bacterium]
MTGTNTMRAGFFVGNRTMELRDAPVPSPGPGEVLLRVLACGVCGTDHHIYEGEVTDGVVPPVVLGHEIAARVEALGDGVTALREGQFCAVDPVIGCGCCRMCRRGRPNLCATPTVIGYRLNGGFAQYLLAPAAKVVPMDESVGPAGGVLCETLACVINGYDRLGFTAGSSAMILGAGTVGLLWAQMLKSSPCFKLLQTEIAGFRREKAERLGADVVLDGCAADLAELVRAGLPDGVDFIVDATGEPQAVQQAIPLLAKGGTFLVFGVCPMGSNVLIDPFELYNKEAKIIASKMPPGTLDRAARMIESGRIPCEEIVTGTFGLEELAEKVAGFNDHRDSEVKVAIDSWR